MRDCETIHRLSRRLRAWDYARRAIERIACALAERSRDWPGASAQLYLYNFGAICYAK